MSGTVKSLSSRDRAGLADDELERRGRSEAGNSLVEVLLAAMVLGLASVALLIAFSTTIAASAEHRRLATSDIVLGSVSQQAIAGVESQLSLFTVCQFDGLGNALSPTQNAAFFDSNVPLNVPSNYSAMWSAKISQVQYWNANSGTFGSNCTIGVPEEITITVTDGNGHQYVNSLVVDYPLANSNSSTNAGPASQLVITTQPSSTNVAGLAFGTQPVVTVEDASGAPVATDLSPVVLSIQTGTGGSVISGCSGNEIAGAVTFTGCSINLTGNYTIVATDGSLTSAASVTFSVSGSTAPYLVFATQPVAGASGSAFRTEPVVKVFQNGTLDTAWSGSITLTSSGGVLSSNCATVTVTNGVSSPSPLTCTFQGGYLYDPISKVTLAVPYTLYAAGSGVVPATSSAFTVTGAGAASQLLFSIQPSGVASASPAGVFSTQPSLTVDDAFGNVVTSYVSSISLGLSAGQTLGGCTSLIPTNGVATFSGCHGSAYATGVTMTATSGALSATSAGFNITGLAANLQFTTQPVPGVSGASFGIQPVVTIYDSNGLVVTSASSAITLVSSGNGTLQHCTGLAPVSGVVSVTTCTFAGVVGTSYTLTASLAGASSATSLPFTPTGAGVPTQLAFTTQPVAGASQSALTTQPVIKVEDSAGNVVTTSGASVSLTPSGGTLTLCRNLTAVTGVVNVSNCVFAGVVGTGYTLNATSSGLTSATSAAFSPSGAGPASQIVLSGCAANVVWNTTCTAKATMQDLYANTVTSFTSSVTFAQIGGTSSVTGLGSATATGGIATVTLTGSAVGAIQINAVGGSFTSGPITITIVGAPQTVAFYTNGTFTTTTSAGTTVYGPPSTYQLYVKGSAGGAIVYVSTTTSICTVNSSTGLVTIVTAGTCNLNAYASAITNYAASSTTAFTLTTNKAANSITVSSTAPASASVGGPTYTAIATATSDDPVVITSGSTGVCTVSSGVVSFVGVGTCTLNFNDPGNVNYAAAAQVTQSFTVTKATPSIVVTNNAVATGGTLIFTATVTGPVSRPTPTGVLAWTITGGAAACSSSTGPSGASNVATYTCSITGVQAANTYSATAAYPGDTIYFGVSGTDNGVTVGKVTPTNVVTNSTPATFASSVVFTATVSGPSGGPTPSGTVTWTVNGTAGVTACTSSVTALGGSGNSATASCTITVSSAGIYAVSDNYTGDANYNVVASAVDSLKGAPSVVVTNNAVATGGTLIFTATVSSPAGGPTPTGVLAWTISGGAAACSSTTGPSGASNVATYTCSITNVLAANTYSATATYPGDSSYSTAAGSDNNVTVAKATPSVLVTNNAVATGGTLIFTATVSGPAGGPTPSGVLAWTISGGAAACSSTTGPSGASNVATYTCSITNVLAANTYSATATFPTGSNYLTAAGSDNNVTVAKANQTLTVTSIGGVNGKPLTLTAGSFLGTGAITYTVSAGTATGCAISGAGPYTLSSTSLGTCNVTAAIVTDSNYNAATSSATTVTLMGTSSWSNSGTSTVSSPTLSAASGSSVLVLVTSYSSKSQTCNSPTGAALGTFVAIPNSGTTWYNPNGPNFYTMCAFSAKGTGSSGTVTVSFNGTGSTTYSTIQVVQITGDNAATFALTSAGSGSSNAPVFGLSGTPAVGSPEILFGDLTNGASPPSWSTTAPSGFTQLGTVTAGSGSTSTVASVYFGGPAASQTTGSISATANWGTIGIQVVP
jgi:hypothetical protein